MDTSSLKAPLPGEDQAVADLIRMLGEKMKREQTQPNGMKRDAHPKQVALVTAEFNVESNIPESLKVGVFNKARSYRAWIRFSNQNAPPRPDKKADIRGAAIKVMNVTGKQLLDGTTEATTQDFVLITTNVFVTRNNVDFGKLIKALTENLAIAWDEKESPFVKVATVRIPAQQFDTKQRVDYGEALSFSPWHALKPHRPLGNVNRGRRKVYDGNHGNAEEDNAGRMVIEGKEAEREPYFLSGIPRFIETRGGEYFFCRASLHCE